MRRRISIRGCVRPCVRPSVCPSVRRSGTPSLRRLLGASYAEYSALFLRNMLEQHSNMQCNTVWINLLDRQTGRQANPSHNRLADLFPQPASTKLPTGVTLPKANIDFTTGRNEKRSLKLELACASYGRNSLRSGNIPRSQACLLASSLTQYRVCLEVERIMTRSKISRSQKFHQYFQILINFWILWWFFIDNTFLTFVMHNFALNKQLLKVLCLKPMKFIKTVLFSFFKCSDSWIAKNGQKYISSAFLSFV